MSGQGKPAEEALGREITIPLLLLPLLAALGGGILIYSTDEGLLPVAEFYGTAAEIIPLLMIAFVLESRAVEMLSSPSAKVYSLLLFAFLLSGELFALLGTSGALREEEIPLDLFTAGLVGGADWSNVIAAGTVFGLVGGFAMLTVLACTGPGWLRVSFQRRPDSNVEMEELREEIRELKAKVSSQG